MTAAALIAKAEARGLALSRRGDRLRVVGPHDAFAALRDQLVASKPDVLALLDEREAATASDTVLAAQRLLREGRFAPEPPVCGFLIGRPGERCRRCGATWAQHDPATNGASGD